MKTNYLIIYSIFLLTSLHIQAQKPTITSFSPTSGVVGTTVTITGTNFNATAAQNIVFFGATKATVSTASTTSLTVTVPTGATFQPITVLNLSNTLSGSSSAPFRVTYPGGSIIAESLVEQSVDFTTGALALFLAIGDLDSDGKTDMVTANFNAGTISIFRNTATLGSITASSFATKADISTGTSPRTIAVGDLDGDGKLDLAVANFGSNTVSVLRNTSSSGSISFAAKVDFTTGINPRGVNIGDFDGDGKPDLAIAHGGNPFMSVLRNNSSGGSISFQAKVDFALAGGGQSSVFLVNGDIDGDGKIDLAVVNYALSTISVFRNTATAGTIDASSFAAKVDFTTGGGPFSVTIGDLDGDGKPDLATANYSGNDDISVLRNTSSSGSISFATKVDFAIGVSPIAVNLGDIDGDGKLDLISSNYSANKISVLRNIATSGSISTNSFATKVDYFTSTGPRFVCVGDLDGDGKPDLAITNETDNTLRVIQNSFISVPTNITGPTQVCTNQTASLSATCVAGTNPTWWEASYIVNPGDPLPPPLFVGSPFITPPLTFTTTYRVSCEQGANASPRVPIVVNVNSNPSPTAPTITASGPTTFCNGGSITLNSNVGNNNALNFVKTSSQYVSVPHSASINLGATFTMEAWIKYSGQNVTILDKGDYDFLWSLNPNINSNQMGFYTKNTGAWSYSTGIVPQNTWTHVAITLNAGTLTFYINGVASGTATVTFSQDNQPMNIGRQQPTFCACNHFNGTMDELRLWNVVRTPSQMLTNMNSTIPTNSAGLVAYYKFDEGSGITTADATGNGNNGTLVNSPTWQVPATSPVNAVVWSPGGAITPSIVVTTAGTYIATITNGYGCSTSSSTIVNVGSNAALVTLTSPTDDYATGIILKTASSVNGNISATNKVTGTAKVDYKAKSIQLNAGFKADSGTVFSAAVGGCN
ncbi:hypothetical protein GCM10011514_08590 [Emticicia aquatilis]|uniref:LamG-like jellyroll fold domain-containing protein n=1 Tax=Emticicia aquatilis TaxID=1537369 RepID=A0A917DL89_9BACT|nr:FG-GAP-like repeat-containing protein [Emticicia aquatilis]GGD46871.1 hypothetical protein GCM10011514_08590 [Emticicia aquatilis]